MATYNGTTGNNSYTGTADGDSVSGNAGNDTLAGLGGVDTIYGGAGNDSLAGGDGNDLIYGDFDPSEDSIANGTFTRTGGAFTIAGWNNINPTTGFGPFYSGTYVALNASAVSTYGEGVQQTIPTVTGQVYSGSLRAFEDNIGTSNHTLLIEVLDGAGSVIYTQTEVILNQTNRAINFSFTAVGPNSTIRLSNPTSTNTVQTDLKLDNVVILGPFDPIGVDTIDAGAGNDLVYAGDGNDSLIGGAGSDSVYGGAGDDAFAVGDIGDDLHYGGAGNDVMNGDTGNDTLYGDGGADTIEGGADNDLVYAGDGNDNLDGGAGNDTVYAGAGDDTWQFDDIGDDVFFGGAGNDVISGDLGNDTLYGDDGNDALEGHEGADFIFGGAGDDYIAGADLDGIATPANRTLTPTVSTDDGSADYIDGGEGNDTIFGNGGSDTLIGGTGNDTINAGSGHDIVYGGLDNDSIDGSAGNDTVYGGTGDDTIVGDSPVLAPSYTTNSAFSQTIAGTNGRANFTATVTSNDGGSEISQYSYGSITNGFWVGNGDGSEVHTHTMSSQVAGAQMQFNATDPGEFPTIVLDGSPINLNTAIANGSVTFNGNGGTYIIDGSGRITAEVGGNLALSGTLTINVPFTSFGVQNSSTGGGGNGSIYSLQIDTNPVNPVGVTNDLLFGDAGNDLIYGGAGTDTLSGGEGNDLLVGGTGVFSDTLYGDAGNDTLDGGEGNDNLVGGTGNDTLTGGTGADVFTVQGADLITDFDAVTGVSANGNLDNDFVDLRGFYNPTTLAAWNAANPGNQYDNALKWLRADQADGILQSADGLRVQNGGAAVSAALLNDENTAVCFTAGTRLATAKGNRPIEKLRVGDLVETADHGLRPIRWIGSMTVDGMGDQAPILISAGALGNRRDIMVSPLHRMLLSGWKVELLFGEDEVIAAAKMLVDGADIRPHPMREVTYYHILFDAHEIVFAEGAGAESFHPGEEGFDTLGAGAQNDITALLPHIAGGNFAAYGPSARRSLRAHEARLLLMGRKMEDTGQIQTAPRKKAVAAR